MTVVFGKEGQLAVSTREFFLFYSHAGGEGGSSWVMTEVSCVSGLIEFKIKNSLNLRCVRPNEVFSKVLSRVLTIH